MKRVPPGQGGLYPAVGLMLATLITILVPAASWAAPPSNDDRAAATVVGSLPYSDSLNTAEATDEPSEASYSTPCEPDPSRTVWYSYTPSNNQSLDANTVGSNYNTVLAVYESGSETALACGFSHLETLTFFAGQEYHFQLGGREGSTGDLQFNLEATLPVIEPADGATISRLQRLEAASSAIGVNEITAELVGAASPVSLQYDAALDTWKVSFDTTKYANGNYNLHFVARGPAPEGGGSSVAAQSIIQVTLDNTFAYYAPTALSFSQGLLVGEPSGLASDDGRGITAVPGPRPTDPTYKFGAQWIASAAVSEPAADVWRVDVVYDRTFERIAGILELVDLHNYTTDSWERVLTWRPATQGEGLIVIRPGVPGSRFIGPGGAVQFRVTALSQHAFTQNAERLVFKLIL